MSNAQVRFPADPIVSNTNDSTLFELTHTSFYSYFKQKVDSVFVSFDRVEFYQVAAIAKKDGAGYFRVFYNKQLLFDYDIREGKINGLGVMYHPNLLGHTYDTPFCQSLFKDGKLDGITTLYNDDGLINEVMCFRKGKYLKHLYHHKSKSRKDLNQGNRKSTSPF